MNASLFDDAKRIIERYNATMNMETANFMNKLHPDSNPNVENEEIRVQVLNEFSTVSDTMFEKEVYMTQLDFLDQILKDQKSANVSENEKISGDYSEIVRKLKASMSTRIERSNLHETVRQNRELKKKHDDFLTKVRLLIDEGGANRNNEQGRPTSSTQLGGADEEDIVFESSSVTGNEDDKNTFRGVRVIDVYNKQPMVDPMKSSECGHTYSKASILSWFRNKPTAKCLYAGCKREITSAGLVPCYVTQRAVEGYLQSQKSSLSSTQTHRSR